MIEEIQQSKDEKFLFITPLLDECHRIAGTTYELNDVHKRPEITEISDKTIHYKYKEDAPLKDKRFKHPDYKGGTKAESLKYLLKYGENIVSTHQLFTNLTPLMLQDASEYTLIIDEALQVYEAYSDYPPAEITKLLSKEILYVDEDKITLRFNKSNFGRNDDSVEDTRYENLCALCDLGQLLMVDGKFIVWELAIDTLKAFKNVWIATYMFEGSQMSAYLKAHDIEYELIKFGNKPSEIKHLINVHEDTKRSRLNTIGDKDTALSSSAFKNRKKELCTTVGKNLDNYYRNVIKAKKDDRFWTGFKDTISAIGTRRYQDEWLAFNTKATNEYGSIHNVAYLLNLYPHPMLVKASSLKGFSIKEDIYAISEMVQFIWRSAIRNGEEINIYIPSKRMRNYLYRWLNDEFE